MYVFPPTMEGLWKHSSHHELSNAIYFRWILLDISLFFILSSRTFQVILVNSRNTPIIQMGQVEDYL
jgi:hypothetical protein